MKVVPLGDKLVIKRLEATEKTAGGILLPDAARDKPQQGRVLSVGDGRLLPDGTRAPTWRPRGLQQLLRAEVSIDDRNFSS
jgi:chaperonin GroES